MHSNRHLFLAALGLLVGGCGGGSADDAGPAPVAAPRTTAEERPAPMPATDRVEALHGAARAVVIDPAVAARPLSEWARQFATQRRVTVSIDPSIARQPVTAALPAQRTGDALVTALADFDVVLGYARGTGGGATLITVEVLPRGSLTVPRRAQPAAPPSATPDEAVETDPAVAMQRIQQDLASGDTDVRRRAMVRSFELAAPLPAATLVSALQADASGEIRLYALMALARHPAIAPQQLRELAQGARYDADAAVRSHAAEVEARLDAAERVFD